MSKLAIVELVVHTGPCVFMGSVASTTFSSQPVLLDCVYYLTIGFGTAAGIQCFAEIARHRFHETSRLVAQARTQPVPLHRLS